MYNCLILEDSLHDQLAIEMVLEQFPAFVPTFVSNPKEFLKEVSKQKFHLYIIDIMLNDALTGIDLIQMIDDSEAWVIISSSMDSKDYYPQFKDLKFSKFYIKKPIDEFVFKTNLETFLFNKSSETAKVEPFITVKLGNYAYKLLASEISYIETNDHATTIFSNGNKYTTYTALKVYEELLKDASFERVNRNTLINTLAINRINIKESYVEIANQRISISRNNKQAFVEKFIGKVY
ncbi:MAG: LytR/AlgR family response regulator transcription factor [Emticicia sp.]|uniref:LytR/AlgR family response regulator transcription factor n=1 Tax=Emticicia sp. TaxID=1930953 RepID=UPI003BA7487D